MKSIYQSSLLTLGVFFSKTISYILSYFIALKYGLSIQSDTILFYFALPDLFVTLLISNSLGVITSPIFKLDKLKSSLGSVLVKSSPIYLGLFFLFILFKNNIFYYLAPGFYKELLSITLLESFLIAATIAIVPLIKIINAYNNVKSKIFFTSFEVVIFNLALISILLQENLSLTRIILTLFFAMSLRLLFVMAPNIKQFNFSQIKKVQLYNAQNCMTALHCFFISILAVAVPALVRSKSSIIGEGSFSLISYILKLSELPLGIWGIVTGALLLPAISGKGSHIKTIKKWFICSCILGLITVFVLYLLNFILQSYPLSIKNLNAQQVQIIFSNLSLLSLGILCRFPTIVLQIYLLAKKQNKLLISSQLITIVSIGAIYFFNSFENIEKNIIFLNLVYFVTFIVLILASFKNRKNIIS